MELHELETAELLRQYEAGGEGTSDELFARYVARLVALVRSRLDRRVAGRIDAEDVVQSAYRSFFLRAREGQFALTRSGELWSLLARITLRKLYRQVGRHHADRRSVRREQSPTSADAEHSPIDDVASRLPTPEEASLLADELASVMAKLSPVEQRVLELRLQDCTIEEIAAQVQRGERTVRRALQTIRERFTHLGPEMRNE